MSYDLFIRIAAELESRVWKDPDNPEVDNWINMIIEFRDIAQAIMKPKPPITKNRSK